MSELSTVFYMQDNNKEPQGYEAYSVVYVIETWWVSLYIITAHLKHTNSTINQCPSWSLCSICRTINKEPQGYEAYSVVYVIETWWVSLYIITAHLKHTNSTINQCPSWSLCSICRITIGNRRDTRHTLWSMRLKLGEFHYTLSLHTWSTLILPLINVRADHCVIRICRITNEEPQGYEAYSVVYVIETWWVSLYIITAHLKHTNSTINQCPSWSLCSICRTTNKEPQGYDWWVSLYIITAHLKHTNSTINQCPSWSLCSICRITIRNRRDTRHTLWCMWLKLGEFHYTLPLHIWSTLILPLINVRADHCVLYAG